jgi:poly-gamma-glutamate synthesis protein (capsule biosynthesis protein)
LTAVNAPSPWAGFLREGQDSMRPPPSSSSGALRIFLCGDVMTGRGIDQVLPHPGDPRLEEDYVRSANDYVRLAEDANGPIERPVGFGDIWGEARAFWSRMAPNLRIMNLETAITTSDAFAPKGINYRMNPANAPCLAAARPDVLTLANNHVLDYGGEGLKETLRTLQSYRLLAAGAGRWLAEAAGPAVVPARAGRVLVYARGTSSAGVPTSWAARPDRHGVAHTGLSEADAQRLIGQVAAERRPGDLAIVSIHWGSNWGYEVAPAQQSFAHALVDSGEVALIHGHSSHHPRPIEIYKNRLILYGCGDLLNDYEGIGGYATFRSNLVLLYFADLDPASGALLRLQLAPLKIQRCRLVAPTAEESAWTAATLMRKGQPFGVAIAAARLPGLLEARWNAEFKAAS